MALTWAKPSKVEFLGIYSGCQVYLQDLWWAGTWAQVVHMLKHEKVPRQTGTSKIVVTSLGVVTYPATTATTISCMFT